MLCSQAARVRRVGSGLHGAGDLRVDSRLARQHGQQSGDLGPEVGGGLAAPLLLSPAHGEELAAAIRRVQVLGGGIGLGAHGRLDRRGEAREHLGIERVRLRQDAVGAGKVAHLARVDHRHGQTGGAEGGHHRLLVAAAGLQHEARHGWQRAHAADQGGVAGRVLATRQAGPVGWTATSRWSRATSMPTYGAAAIPLSSPCVLASRPALWIRARSGGPGNCSGSGPALRAGTTPLSHGLARDPGLIGLSRPGVCPRTFRESWEHTRLGTYKGWGEGEGGGAPTPPTGSSGPQPPDEPTPPQGGSDGTAQGGSDRTGEPAYADIPGFCKSATVEEIRKHGHVLTPGRYVGAAPQEDDGEPFEEKMARLTKQWREQQAEARRLDAAIEENLARLGFGTEQGSRAEG